MKCVAQLTTLTSIVVELIVAVALVNWSASRLVADPPSIVFILADDLSWSDLACYGHPLHDTPNIDRLASEGMRFDQAYAPAPICSASRAAILTGKTPARLNFEFVTKNEAGGQQLDVPLQSPPFTLNLPLDEVTLGEVLSAAGYTTGFFGKWHVNQHYQRYLGWSPTHGPLRQGFADGSSDFGSHPYAYRTHGALKDLPVPAGDFPQDSLIDKAIEYIESRRDRPFFLYLSQYYVHDPVHSRCRWLIDKYQQRYPPEALPVRASYGAMVETLDHLVGRMLEALDTAGLREETLVVLTSDNGGHPNYTTNAPLRGSKWNLYEGGIRVPLIVRWPGHVKPGSRCDFSVYGCDLYPTFCQAAETSPPAGDIDGVSLMPLLTAEESSIVRSRPLVWHFPYYHPERRFAQSPEKIGIADFVTSQTRPHSAIRSGDWKLLQFYEDNRLELYNLADDLGEQVNLADSERAVAARLRQELADALKQAGARFPTRASSPR